MIFYQWVKSSLSKTTHTQDKVSILVITHLKAFHLSVARLLEVSTEIKYYNNWKITNKWKIRIHQTKGNSLDLTVK